MLVGQSHPHAPPMTDSQTLHRAADCVLQVEHNLRTADLWQADVPSPAAMASRTPFCADTLTFAQWLQFIFVPRMRELIEAGGPLPGASAIAVMAEVKLDTDQADQARIVAALADFDALIGVSQ